MDLISRTIEECESRGWYAPRDAITEHRIKARSGRPTTKDFLGIIDLVVFPPRACAGIQVTSSSNHAARRNKVFANPHLRHWLEANFFWIWSWRQNAKGVWVLRHENFYLDKGRVESVATDPLTPLRESLGEPPATR